MTSHNWVNLWFKVLCEYAWFCDDKLCGVPYLHITVCVCVHNNYLHETTCYSYMYRELVVVAQWSEYKQQQLKPGSLESILRNCMTAFIFQLCIYLDGALGSNLVAILVNDFDINFVTNGWCNNWILLHENQWKLLITAERTIKNSGVLSTYIVSTENSQELKPQRTTKSWELMSTPENHKNLLKISQVQEPFF